MPNIKANETYLPRSAKRTACKPSYTDFKLLIGILYHIERWLLLTVSLLGISGICDLVQCVYFWISIIAGTEITRRIARMYAFTLSKEKTARCSGRQK